MPDALHRHFHYRPGGNIIIGPLRYDRNHGAPANQPGMVTAGDKAGDF